MLWIEGYSIMRKAPVNKIIPFSNVDGPGNRTSLFFQGCPFNCMFCHNPETIHLCSHCGQCVARCPVHALSVSTDGHVIWDRAACVQCDTCIRVCPHDASPRVEWMTVPDVLRFIQRTLPYIDGITTSGGECTQYMDFLLELFSQVQSLHKSCLIDSNGSFDFAADPRVLAVCDGVMLDVKAADPAFHQKLVAFPRDMVLKNLDYLLSAGKLYEVRTVIFPDRDTDNETTVRYVAKHIQDRCIYKIIRYRPYGVREKYQEILGREETEKDYAARFASLARQLGAAKAYVV